MKHTLILLAVIAGLLTSCSSRHHLRKMDYHKRMALAKGAVIKTDTVVQVVEFVIPEVVHDTTIVVKEGETKTIEKEKVVTVVRRLKGDTIRITQTVKADTVIKHVRVGYPIEISTGPSTIRIAGLCLSLFAVGFIVGVLVKRRNNH